MDSIKDIVDNLKSKIRKNEENYLKIEYTKSNDPLNLKDKIQNIKFITIYHSPDYKSYGKDQYENDIIYCIRNNDKTKYLVFTLYIGFTDTGFDFLRVFYNGMDFNIHDDINKLLQKYDSIKFMKKFFNKDLESYMKYMKYRFLLKD